MSWSSEEFETPTHETATFRVVLSDDGLPLDRLVRFGGMFFARLRGTHGVHGAHKFPGEWVIVEEGALIGYAFPIRCSQVKIGSGSSFCHCHKSTSFIALLSREVRLRR